MLTLLKNAFISSAKRQRHRLILIFAPLLNFLSGINYDLHAPSLPAIANYFGSSIAAAKDTIPVALLGFALGCVILGALFDIKGRRPMIVAGMLVYAAASFSAVFSPTIGFLLLMRFVQGFSISCVSIGCRAILMDTLSGHDFKIALLYVSLAFGLGPILAPFAGGFLQHHFGWKANFVVYGIVSLILLLAYLLFIGETKHTKTEFSLKTTLASYREVLKHPVFVPGCLIVGIAQIQLLIYTTCGAFVVENVLHRTAIIYGNTALIVSLGYFAGTLINRLFIKEYPTYTLVYAGFVMLTFSIVIQTVYAFLGPMNLVGLVLPMTLIGFSNGFIFVNIFSFILSQSTQAGIATALLVASIMILSTLGTFIASHMPVSHLGDFAGLFAGSLVLQLIIFKLFFSKVLKSEAPI